MSAPLSPEERDAAMRSTLEHTRTVGTLLNLAAFKLVQRGTVHDASKFSPEEFPGFASATTRLSGLTYGTPEYEQSRRELGPTLDTHYSRNRHHPEYHTCGVESMTLLDQLEMLADWKAATLRHTDGASNPDAAMARSLMLNGRRFSISPAQLDALVMTALELKWTTLEAVVVALADANYDSDTNIVAPKPES